MVHSMGQLREQPIGSTWRASARRMPSSPSVLIAFISLLYLHNARLVTLEPHFVYHGRLLVGGSA